MIGLPTINFFTLETLHDEECETVSSVKLKRQVVKKKKKKERRRCRSQKISRSFPSYLLLIGSIREMEDRPGPLRGDYLSLSLYFSLFLPRRTDIGSHCIESLTELSNHHFLLRATYRSEIVTREAQRRDESIHVLAEELLGSSWRGPLGRVLRLRRHRPLTRSEGVQVLEIQTDPRRWVQSDAGFPLRIRLDRPNLLLWLLVSGPRLYTGFVYYLLLLPGRPNLLLPRSR